jgi:tRNA dimethylallyltransferase
LAERLNGEIISVDSRLFYRGMDIGTAKPSQAERARVPHHLIDVTNPDEGWSLAHFQEVVKALIAEIQGRGRLPICVGGTGQYIRAITDGWRLPELPANEPLREALANWADEVGREGLHQRLRVLDPVAAEKMEPRNLRRTIRALEVIFMTGKRFSEQRQRVPLTYRVLQIGLTRPKPELLARIEQRVDAMMAAGFADEVRGLLADYPPDLRSFSAIGYPQLIAAQQGQCTMEEAVAEIKRLTKKFVRRQYTWFKPTDPQIHWLSIGENTLLDAEQAVRTFIET